MRVNKVILKPIWGKGKRISQLLSQQTNRKEVICPAICQDVGNSEDIVAQAQGQTKAGGPCPHARTLGGQTL